MNKWFFVLVLLAGILIGSSCRKEEKFVRQAVDLRFSQDTIYLDTVFSQVGSSTRTLRVFNPTNDNLYIDRINLGRGAQSYYRLNVNGTPTKDIRNVELLAKDSLTIFIEVTANANGSPELLYTDSIVFHNSGNVQDVKLVALTRDAHFYYPTNSIIIERNPPLSDIVIPYSILDCNTTWSNDKPHVIYGYAVVDSSCALTIEAGTEVHFHSGGGLWVTSSAQLLIDPADAGKIDVNPVLIQGDRLEPFYENEPGQWGGILGGIFLANGSTGNVIRNAIIKNATIGVRVDSTANATPTLEIFDSHITNHSRVGLYGGFANIHAENLVVSNCGLYGFYALGGRYDFTHCTFGNYYAGGRTTPAIGLFNYFEGPGGSHRLRDIISAEFKNSIVYGNRSVEFGVGYDPAGTLNFVFRSSLIRLSEDPQDGAFTRDDPSRFDNCTFNLDPEFINPANLNYALDSISPAIDSADPVIAQDVPNDILKVSRTASPDRGAYERQ